MRKDRLRERCVLPRVTQLISCRAGFELRNSAPETMFLTTCLQQWLGLSERSRVEGSGLVFGARQTGNDIPHS